ncbi:MAG: O-antigen ligase family protein [Myxococcota bacterium]
MSAGESAHPPSVRAFELILILGACVAIAFISAVEPALVIPAIVLIVVAALALRSPFVSLVVFILILLTRPADFVPALAVFSPAKVAAFGALSIFLATRLLDGRITWARVPQNRALIFFAVAAFLSGLLGSDPTSSRIVYLDVFAKILILYFLIVNLVDTWSRALVVEYALLAGAVFLSVYAIYQRFTSSDLIEGSRAAAVGLLGDPNDLAFTLMMAVPFAILAVRESHRLSRLVHLAILGTLLAGVAVTQSRGGILALGAALYFLFRHRVKSRIVLVALMVVALVGLAVASGLGSRESYDPSGGDASATGRLDAWKAGARMVLAHPLLGVGFDQFVANYFTYVQNPVEWTARTAHNTFVLAIAETGFAGFIPFMMLIAVTARDALTLEHQPGPAGLARALRQSQLARLCAILVAAFFLSQTWNWFLYIVIALTAATARVGRIESAAAAAASTPQAPPPAT